MTTVTTDHLDPSQADYRTAKNGQAEPGRPRRKSSPQEVTHLLADVQSLLERLANEADPEISRLRSRIEEGVASARSALTDRTEQVQRQAREALAAGDTYVRERPWQSIGVAAVLGLAAGLLIARR